MDDQINFAPVTLFVYNRPHHTKRVLDTLSNNEFAIKSELYIFSDASKNKIDEKNVRHVRKILPNYRDKFKKVHLVFRNENFGMEKSLISGINEIFRKYDNLIFLEDDIICSTKFLWFLNTALEKYKNCQNVFSVSAYNYPTEKLGIDPNYPQNVFLAPRFTAWGFGIWKNRWEKIDWELKNIDQFFKNSKNVRDYRKTGADKYRMLKNHINNKARSIGIRIDYAQHVNRCLSVHPVRSYVSNIGHDGTGENCIKSNRDYYISNKLNETTFEFPDLIKDSTYIEKKFTKFQKRMYYYNLIKYVITTKILGKLINK